MTSIDASDILFATVTLRGIVIISMTLSGLNGYGQIVNRILKEVNRASMGLAKLHVRNATQGWADTRAIMIA